jgi:hypothetical protein
MSYEIGVLKAMDNELLVYAEDPYEPPAEGEEIFSQTHNYRRFEGVLKIDGKLRKWKAYPVTRFEGKRPPEAVWTTV